MERINNWKCVQVCLIISQQVGVWHSTLGDFHNRCVPSLFCNQPFWNLFSSHIVERVIRQYITESQTLSNIPASPPSNSTHFFKLPYVGPFSIVAQNRLRKLLYKRYCNNLDVKLAFSSFKIRNTFSVKGPVPVELRSNVVYKLTCASCNSCYIGETSRHLTTRIREHLNRDRTSHIFQHIQQSEACRNSCSAECFEVIDHGATKFQVKINNKQLYHVNR